MMLGYLRLVLFAFGLLIGIQIPGFMDDYAKRVDAHRIEAQEGLNGFQATATRYFNGDLDALVAHYRENPDPIIRNDADSVEVLVRRSRLLEAEWDALQGPWYQRTWHMLTRADNTLLQETYSAYTYQILLTPSAIVWAVASGFLFAFVVEGLVLLLASLFSIGSRPARHMR
ncbi:DUF2937 family protein [Pseudomonas matsuisoli]|uniref:DUF2937 domain-containing protein n=1 Tax=Pseudomonas matsuisoli TaxID=1515666 RepID=A0A917UR79_9PSED|nr:DUF2937 family protein [Pseudomonas matsuisoli]GGJ78451.1 hypothetical protein GCM10009304_00440 [Pseudomonas matsuisoli]